ncbi:MAG: hypothetical protein J1F65_04555 [Clostridiales bacterium]|nr:hypothetical protein [Clostridiales bacterium]
MQSTNDTLRRHLSNVIYIENSFGLELFKQPIEQPVDVSPVMRSRVSARGTVANVDDDRGTAISVEDFFKASQNYSNDINVLPYLFQPEILNEVSGNFLSKLSTFPLIIIDWQLEDGENGKNGLDVFVKIINNSDVLHYYVIYSKDVSAAVEAFKSKYPSVAEKIEKNEIAVIGNNAIVLFCDKVSHSINDIIEQLCKFTEDNYGFLPQMFLSVKQQIEDRTAILYNQFMGLDSMMLPQLIADEVYSYEGLQEEVLISVVFNQLRNSVKIENNGNLYLKSVVNKLLKKEFTEEDFKRAKKVVGKLSNNLTFKHFNERLKEISDLEYLKSIDFEGLKNASTLFFDGKTSDEEDKKTSEKISGFILFLSICSDANYFDRYIKLLSIIKWTDYNLSQQWTFEECLNRGKIKGLCQGDVFIDDSNSFLLCITPSCQLLRPDKINNTYTFLKGHVTNTKLQSNQKQAFTMHLANQNKTKILPINWAFYSPVVIDFSNAQNITPYNGYKRFYRLNTEFTHKIVELYSEHIKQIGVEELFGKKNEGEHFISVSEGGE